MDLIPKNIGIISKMTKRFRRMIDSDIRSMVADLDKWALGQLGSKLTWRILENRFGFSRQALQAKSEIKAAYDLAKQSLSGGLVRTKEQAVKQNDELILELERVHLELAEYKRKEMLWKQRWQRIAFHVRQKGIQVHAVDKVIPDGGGTPTEKEVAKILQLFDKDIPPSGRV